MSLFLLNRTTAGAEAAVSAGSIPVRLPTFHARYTVIKPVGNLHGSRFLPSASKKKSFHNWYWNMCYMQRLVSVLLFVIPLVVYVSCYLFQWTRNVAFCGCIWCMCPTLPSFVGQRLYGRSTPFLGKWMCALEKCLWVSSIPSLFFSLFL